MDSESLLVATDLAKIYQRSHLGRTTYTTGVVDLNLTVNKGEVFGLLGLNGSGKTTTIKLILGLLFPTKGTVTVLGHRVPHPQAQKQIGYLPEVPYFYRNLSPREVLHLYGSLSKLESKALSQRIDEVLRLVQMEHVKNKPMREFSKGMLQRIGLSQAILHNPDLLILDEPVTGLDPLGIRQTRQLIQDLNNQGKTIFFSSHSISELERLAQRVGILFEGRLVRLIDHLEWKMKPGRLEELFIETLEAQGATGVSK
ncbi:MAG: ABC transporter ATP-binding protein [Elusimicrobia bacterium]|nr:ABC transporter ATP-binding protein [Candidatus Obscuribacterium magneticum]